MADLLAIRLPKSVHIHGDMFRRMVVSGRADMTPNPSRDAIAQLNLRYDLAAMAGDVIAVIDAAGHLDHDTARRVHLVGHSLGGAVVSAAGAAISVASVLDIDQSLQLSAFKEQLVDELPLEPHDAMVDIVVTDD